MIASAGLVEAPESTREVLESNLRLCIPADGQILGKLVLDQWGQMVKEDPEDPTSDLRRVTYFEVFRDPGDDPYKKALYALAKFVSVHKPTKAPIYLGTTKVTEDYIKLRLAPQD